MDATVTVKGQAIVPAQPDEVRMVVEISALNASPQEALADVAGRSEELEKLFAELEVPERARSTSGASVREEREWSKDGYIHRGYRSINRVSLVLRDSSVVGKLMREATTRCAAQFSGPWWQVASDNPARREAHMQAALDARRKAEAYAEALGVRLGAVVEVIEPGLRRTPPNGERPVEVRAMAMSAEEPEIDVKPGELDVGAAVEVTFRLEQG